jgi:excisionase family DNA binding protein
MNRSSTPASLPSAAEIEIARESSRDLAVALTSRAESQQFDFRDENGGMHSVKLPTTVLKLLVNVLSEIGQGNAVSIIPIHAELTTQEAADLLNVSRPYFVQVLEKGDIPFRRVNTHRRVRYQDVIDYKRRIDDARLAALDELTAQAQELGMGY